MLLLFGMHVPLVEVLPSHVLLVFILVPVGGAVWCVLVSEAVDKKWGNTKQ
jgi:hypothetical protein